MGSSDTPPLHVPSWVVPASTALLISGVILWDITYILMARRSHQTKSYGMPLIALAANVSWEIMYAIFVAEEPLEQFGFAIWLLLDLPVIWTTIRAAPYEWAHAPLVRRNFTALLALMLTIGLVGNWSFAYWWLAVPGRGSGDKSGKWWHGSEGYDCTELAFWSAGISQLTIGPGCIAMLLVRGHSGGASYGIWIVRSLGTLLGLISSSAVLWWYWPENHEYFVNPFAIFIMATCTGSDLIYPFVLAHVRATEKTLPDGRLVAGDEASGVTVGKKTA